MFTVPQMSSISSTAPEYDNYNRSAVITNRQCTEGWPVSLDWGFSPRLYSFLPSSKQLRLWLLGWSHEEVLRYLGTATAPSIPENRSVLPAASRAVVVEVDWLSALVPVNS